MTCSRVNTDHAAASVSRPRALLTLMCVKLPTFRTIWLKPLGRELGGGAVAIPLDQD